MTVRDVTVKVAEQLPKGIPLRGIITAINTAVNHIMSRGRWHFQESSQRIAYEAAESTTVDWTLTNGSASVTGTFPTAASAATKAAEWAGERIRFDGEIDQYRIGVAAGDVSDGSMTLTLTSPYRGDTPASTVTAEITHNTYNLASNAEEILAVFDATNGLELRQSNPRGFHERRNRWLNIKTSQYAWEVTSWQEAVSGTTSSNTVGDVTTVTWTASTTNEGRALELRPEPSGTGVLEVYYWYRPAQVSSVGDTIDIPSYLDEVLIQGTLAHLHRTHASGQEQVYRAKEQYQVFNKLLADNWLRNTEFMEERIRMVRADSPFDSDLTDYRWLGQNARVTGTL